MKNAKLDGILVLVTDQGVSVLWPVSISIEQVPGIVIPSIPMPVAS